MINAGSVQVKLFADTKQYMTAMAAAGTQMKTLGTSAQNFAKVSAIAFAAFTAASAKMATDFDKRLREISTLIIGVTEKDIKNMSREIRDLANTTGKALDDIGKAKYDIISAGFTGAAESAALLDTATRLAVGGVTSVTNSADLLTSSLNAFSKSGFEAENAADVLFTTVRLGKTTMDELVGSVGRVFPTARVLGASLADVGAAMATITAGGIKTYEAATYLNQAFTKLGAPSDSAAKAMARYGIQVYKTKDGMFDMLKTIKQFQGYDLEQMRKFFPEIRAIKAVLAMSNNMEFLERSLTQTNDAAGATQVAFKKMEESFSVQFQKSIMKIKDIMIDIGTSVLPDIIKMFDDFSNSIKKNKVQLVSLFKGITKLFLVLVDLIVHIPTIIALFVELKIVTLAMKVATDKLAIATLKANAAALANPYVLLAAAIGAVIIVAGKLVSNLSKARNELIKFADEAKNIKVKNIPLNMKINVSAYFDKNADALINSSFLENTKIKDNKRYNNWADNQKEISKSRNFPTVNPEIRQKRIQEAGKTWIDYGKSFDTGFRDSWLFYSYADWEPIDLPAMKWDGKSTGEYLSGLYSDVANTMDDFNDIDNTFDFAQIKIGGAGIGGDLGISTITKQLDNFILVLKDFDLGTIKDPAKLFDLSGINLDNYYKAVDIVGLLGIKMSEVSKYDLSAFGIDTIELEAAKEALDNILMNEIKAQAITMGTIDLDTQKLRIAEMTTSEVLKELEAITGIDYESLLSTKAFRSFGDEISDMFVGISDTISSTMADSFTEIVLSGRVAMQELESYNKGLTNSFRTTAEIQEDAWANMWNNILTDTVRAISEMIIKYTLLTAALVALNIASDGMLSVALGATNGVGKDGETVGKGWSFIADLFKESGGEGFTNMFVKDAVISPSGQVIHTDPKDYLIATKTPEDLGGGSGGTVHYHIQAMDAKSFEDYLVKNPKALARGIGKSIEKRDLKFKQSGNTIRAEY